MLDLILFVLAGVMNSGGDGSTQTAMVAEEPAGVVAVEDAADGATESTTESIGIATSEGTSLLDGVVEEDAPSLGTQEDFVAEPQIPTGKFTTATEIKPILAATKGNWVAVREYNGQDLLYVTHIWAWRCGLHQMRYAINGGDMQVWPLPPCHENTNSPNAIIDSDGLPYATFDLGSIKSISVELLMDDLSTDSSDYVRTDVLMP